MWTNAPAYCISPSATSKKSFITWTPAILMATPVDEKNNYFIRILNFSFLAFSPKLSSAVGRVEPSTIG
jgi:hypothetical protein